MRVRCPDRGWWRTEFVLGQPPLSGPKDSGYRVICYSFDDGHGYRSALW